MSEVGLFHNEACSLHDTGWEHPEHQGRLRAVAGALAKVLPELNERVVPVDGAASASALMELVHDPDYVRSVLDASADAGERQSIVRLEADTVVNGASADAALAASGCVVGAIDAVAAGRFASAFCPVRPPGHHATRDRAMGFCLFNHVALGARYAIAEGLADRVLIVDWDVHHGNGTQDIFWRADDVFYVSMHQHPHYPGTGGADETGAGPGEGTTLNVPLPPGLPADRYVESLVDAVRSAASSFRPDLVLISAGFDAALEDPLGGFTLTGPDYRRLTMGIAELARQNGCGVVSLLEGGYNPPELGRNVVAHVTALADHAAGSST